MSSPETYADKVAKRTVPVPMKTGSKDTFGKVEVPKRLVPNIPPKIIEVLPPPTPIVQGRAPVPVKGSESQ